VVRDQLGEAALDADVARIEREYFDLFIGLGRGELLPYASYYLTGFLNERPLSRLLTTLLYALKDRGLKRGLASLCLGGGEAVAMAIELEG